MYSTQGALLHLASILVCVILAYISQEHKKKLTELKDMIRFPTH